MKYTFVFYPFKKCLGGKLSNALSTTAVTMSPTL